MGRVRMEHGNVWRGLPGTIVAAAGLAFGAANSASGGVFSWNAGSGSWFNASNWAPLGLPGTDDSILIGNLPAAHGATVMFGPSQVHFGYFELSNGVTLDMNGGELVSFSNALLTGAGTRLIVRPSAGPNSSDFIGDLTIDPGATLDLRDDVEVTMTHPAINSGVITGRGLVKGGSPFVNHGTIRPSNNGGLEIRGGFFGDTAIDLDGNGAGHLQLDTQFAVLEVVGTELDDTFSGQIDLVPGALLTMTLDTGWTADQSAEFNVAGFNNPAAASQINGSPLSFGGVMTIGAAQGRLRILAPTTYLPTADVDVGATDGLQTTGATTVEGGDFTIGQGGFVRFDGPTTMKGGVFTTPSTTPADGSVQFNGDTEWRGTVTLNGYSRQDGDATVPAIATINADYFDLDGVGGATRWDIDAALTVNADRIGPLASNVIHSVIDLGATLGARLTVNLSNPDEGWSMAGHMTMAGLGALTPTRLAGSRIDLWGALDLTAGSVQISADATFIGSGSGAQVMIAEPTSVMRMNAETIVEAGADFFGFGAIRNSATGRLWLDDGATLDTVGLLNDGRMEIDGGAGIASVDRFTQSATGEWTVSLGGLEPGVEHDGLIVSGGQANLAGRLRVEHMDLDGGVYEPAIGDQFVILNAVGGVVGEFDADPISAVGPIFYRWAVDYNPNTVVLRLESIDCLGDVNADGLIDFTDLNLILSAFNTVDGDPGFNAAADVDNDGEVGFTDLNIVLAAFNVSCD